MKKIISFLAVAIIAFSASFSVFAASSPGGGVKPDQFDIVGTLTKDDAKYPSVVVSLDGVKKDTTSDKGEFRIDDIKPGDHVITFTVDSVEIGKLSFTLTKGTDTGFKLLSDGSYNITVAANVTAIAVNFDIDDGKVVITKLVAGNGSSGSPGTADVATTACAVIFVISLAGVAFSAYCRKKYSM